MRERRFDDLLQLAKANSLVQSYCQGLFSLSFKTSNPAVWARAARVTPRVSAREVTGQTVCIGNVDCCVLLNQKGAITIPMNYCNLECCKAVVVVVVVVVLIFGAELQDMDALYCYFLSLPPCVRIG